MAKETERKFLVKNQTYKKLGKREYYRQAYLSTDSERIVRIRIEGKRAVITVKGDSNGISRREFEYEIPPEDAREMLKVLCIQPIIEKYRYKIEYKGFIWEVDEFLGENQDLVIAEIELDQEDQEFKKPSWIGKEVTGDSRYYNASLVRFPYSQWKEASA